MPVAPQIPMPYSTDEATSMLFLIHLEERIKDVSHGIKKLIPAISCAIIHCNDFNNAITVSDELDDCPMFEYVIHVSHFTNECFIIVTYKV